MRLSHLADRCSIATGRYVDDTEQLRQISRLCKPQPTSLLRESEYAVGTDMRMTRRRIARYMLAPRNYRNEIIPRPRPLPVKRSNRTKTALVAGELRRMLHSCSRLTLYSPSPNLLLLHIRLNNSTLLHNTRRRPPAGQRSRPIQLQAVQTRWVQQYACDFFVKAFTGFTTLQRAHRRLMSQDHLSPITHSRRASGAQVRP